MLTFRRISIVYLQSNKVITSTISRLKARVYIVSKNDKRNKHTHAYTCVHKYVPLDRRESLRLNKSQRTSSRLKIAARDYTLARSIREKH